MGKKNKKNSKINQRIRKYFDDDPFDVGIVRVDTETLSELFHTLGIYDVEFSKDTLVKTARMLWSEADSDYRSDILNFFAANETIYLSDKPKKENLQKIEIIEELLKQLDATQDEQQLIIDSFRDTRTKKITIKKIESKLLHIRFEKKKEQLQSKLDGVFDIDNSLEFNASLRYKIFQQHFHKILTLHTKPYSYEFIDQTPLDELIERISQDKQSVISAKQNSIDKFIRELKIPHDYLTNAEIESALRSSPPKTKVKYPLLKDTILLSLISMSLDVESLEVHDEELLLKVNESVKLPFSDMEIPYILELHIELNSLLETIWNSQPLDFGDILSLAKTQQEESFFEELEELVLACGNYATLLHFSKEELHQKVYQYLKDLMRKNLTITPKIARKTTRIFIYNIQEQLI
jgi:ATP-dependent RNA helicase SUPV3L1/SUV3